MIKENVKYKALTTIRYLGDGFFYPFFALYLVNRGLTESRVGFILSISPLLAIIMNPIYSKICNNVNKLKITLGIISILEGIMILLIGLSSNFYLITALTLLMAIFGSCHYGLMDSLVALYSDSTAQNYSSFRLYGSAAYIVATSTGGYICKLVSYEFAFGVSCALFIVSGIFYIFLKNIKQEKEEIKEKKSDFKDYKVILKNKRFIAFMLFYGLSMALIFTNNNFFPTYLETRGIGSDGYGLVYAYFVVVEVVVLLVLTKVKIKASPYLLLLIAALSLVLRIIPCYFEWPVWSIIAISGLRGVGYAIMLHVSFKYVIGLLGTDKATKGIMLATLLYSVLLFLFNNGNGFIIEKYSYNTFFLVNLIASIFLVIYIGVIIILDRHRANFKKNTELEE